MKEIRGNSKCPCGSGLRYSGCCRKRRLKWKIDEDGNVFKEVPLVPEAVEVLDRTKEDYRRIFERDCRKTDPVFLARYMYSDEEIERMTIREMEHAGISPQIIHAYKKTGGLMLTEANEALATTKDMEDWKQAIDEYFYLEENPPDPDPIELLFDSLGGELDSCIICLGYTLDQGIDALAVKVPSSSMYFSVDDYVLLCATKSIKTLRAIKALTTEEIGSDCLALARHIDENYLHCIFVINKPEMMEHLIDAVVGLKMGTHEYAKNSNGKTNGRRILRLSDGKSFIGQISAYRMAESSNYGSDLALFDYMYSFLSDYTHPSFNSLSLVVAEKGSRAGDSRGGLCRRLQVCAGARSTRPCGPPHSRGKNAGVPRAAVAGRHRHYRPCPLPRCLAYPGLQVRTRRAPRVSLGL